MRRADNFCQSVFGHHHRRHRHRGGRRRRRGFTVRMRQISYDTAVDTAGDAELQQKSTFDELNFFPEVPESNKATEMLLASADHPSIFRKQNIRSYYTCNHTPVCQIEYKNEN